MTAKDGKTGSDRGPETRITPSYRPRQVEKTAPCQVGCANCGDIRAWIGTVAQRRKMGLSREESFARAWRTITDVNPFPSTLGRICPHPCENHCNRSDLDEPLAINALERFLGDFAIETGLPLPRKRNRNCTEWLGVVGAGPSGLSFAYQSVRRGYRVTVYDARDKAGGMLRYGVPDYRLPQEVLDAEIRKIQDLGVEMVLGTTVGRDIALEELRRRHDALYLGIGAQAGRGLGIPGEQGPSVWTGTEYLSRINTGETIDVGSHVVVIGGGNTAIDAARCARRSGAEVTILYRRSREEMPAIAHEIEDALDEGVLLEILALPQRIRRGTDGQPVAVEVQRMRLAEPDSSGRPRPVPTDDPGFTIAANAVIEAVSQVPVLDGLEELDHEGDWLLVDAGAALGDDIMVGGDALGLGIAGNAIVQGRWAAEQLHFRLRGSGEKSVADPEVAGIDSSDVLFDSKPESQAVHTPTLKAEQRIGMGMAEVAGTITEEQFLAEVERCFSCGSCFGCEQCYMYCTAGCFTKVEEVRPGMYFSLNLDECQECGKCVEVCPCGFLEISPP